MYVKRKFVDLHARTLCHATEDLEKVELAMTNALGPVELNLRSTEGHHGNPLTIIEAVIDGEREISEFFQRLREEDIEAIAGSLATRVDNGCNLFIRLDKQSAFLGDLKTGDERRCRVHQDQGERLPREGGPCHEHRRRVPERAAGRAQGKPPMKRVLHAYD